MQCASFSFITLNDNKCDVYLIAKNCFIYRQRISFIRRITKKKVHCEELSANIFLSSPGNGGMRGAVGGGRRGMFGTVQRAVKTGVVGGATDDYDNASTTSTTSSTTPIPTSKISRLSLSSSYSPPISPTWHPSCSSPTYRDEFEWVSVDGAEDETLSSYGFNDDFVFRPVPSKDEVQNAVLSIQQ